MATLFLFIQSKANGFALQVIVDRMNLDALAANIKRLDLSQPLATSEAERDYFRYYGLNLEQRYENLVHHFGHFPCGRFDIVAHYFEQANAKGTCFIVHGYYDHAGLYAKLIDYCVKRHFSVVIFDLPGHGLSTGERASIQSFGDYQQVLNSVLTYFKEVAPAPWYAIGQSTGGAILMDYILAGGDRTFEKTILLAPLYRPSHWVLGSFYHSMAHRFLKRVKRNFIVNSHDESFVQFLRDRDPLQDRYLSVDWVTALKNWIRYFDRLPTSDYAPLVIQGKGDTTVDWRKNIPVIQKKFPNAKVYYVANGFHQLANESEEIRQAVYSAIDLYLDVYKPAQAVGA